MPLGRAGSAAKPQAVPMGPAEAVFRNLVAMIQDNGKGAETVLRQIGAARAAAEDDIAKAKARLAKVEKQIEDTEAGARDVINEAEDRAARIVSEAEARKQHIDKVMRQDRDRFDADKKMLTEAMETAQAEHNKREKQIDAKIRKLEKLQADVEAREAEVVAREARVNAQLEQVDDFRKKLHA